mmetsp:Transcript_60215/g.95643  ORF Transcript_60215/g.95643 Transcript_60215/m.95643 type:complete len:251 (-) Transcript_60215:105-857(-)
MFHVGQVVATVLTSAWPNITANAMDDRLLPLSPKATPVAGEVHPSSVDDIIGPLSLILGAVNPMIAAPSILLPLTEKTFIVCTFHPSFGTMTILKIIAPLSSVGGASLVVIDSNAAGHIRIPLSDVNVAITVRESSFARRQVLTPLALVLRTIRPSLTTITISHIVLPLAHICCARLELVRDAIFQIFTIRLEHVQLGNLPVEIAGRLLQCLVVCGVHIIHTIHIQRPIGSLGALANRSFVRRRISATLV